VSKSKAYIRRGGEGREGGTERGREEAEEEEEEEEGATVTSCRRAKR